MDLFTFLASARRAKVGRARNCIPYCTCPAQWDLLRMRTRPPPALVGVVHWGVVMYPTVGSCLRCGDVKTRRIREGRDGKAGGAREAPGCHSWD